MFKLVSTQSLIAHKPLYSMFDVFGKIINMKLYVQHKEQLLKIIKHTKNVYKGL